MSQTFQLILTLTFILLISQGEANSAYATMRSDCAARKCQKVEKENKFARDMCIHKCMSKECYFDIYWDIDRQIPKFQNKDLENLERERRKKKFADC